MPFRALLLTLVLAPASALAQPDLAVTAFSPEPDAVAVGEPVVLAYTLCNPGSVTIPEPVVGFFLSEDAVYDRPLDRLLGDHSVAPLDAGACTDEIPELTIPMDVQPGDYTLFAVADYDDLLVELDETNNVLGTPFTVLGVLVPPIDVVLNPVDPPVTTSPGGTFAFEVLVTNVSMTSETFDLWAEVVRPGGQIARRPRLGPYRLTLAPGETLGPATLQLRVPAVVPPGVYLFRVSAGTFPDQTTDAESFEVEVLPGPAHATAGAAEWTVEQLAGPPLAGHSPAHAEAAAVREAAASPNPARGAATITFDLAEAAKVRLGVYDLLGRAVLMLPAQALAAGPHALRLDVRALPAGTYLYRLEVADAAGGAGRRAAATGHLTVVQ